MVLFDCQEEMPGGPVAVARKAGSDWEENTAENLGEAGLAWDESYDELEDSLLHDPQMDCAVEERALIGGGNPHLGDEFLEPDLELL
jgi:hypothetical protein